VTDQRTRTALTKPQVALARKLSLYLLLRPVVAQHELDGGTVIPAGKMIFVLEQKDDVPQYTYRCTEMIVAAPYRVDPRQGLPEGVLRMSTSDTSPFRIMVCPTGQELEWLRRAAKRSGVSDPCLR